MKSKIFSNLLVLAISFGGAFYCARLLYIDIYISKATVDGLSEAGFIKEKHETVKRKFAENMLWDLVNKDEKLYWNDSIQTADKSQATISLNDGNEIKLGATSLVVLEKDNDKLALNLKSGQLFLNSKDSGTKVKVNGVFLDNAKGKTLSLSMNEEKGQVTAVQTAADGTGKQIIINQDGSKEENEIPIVLDTPVALYRKIINSDLEKIDFSWKRKKQNTKIQIATDNEFKNVVLSKLVDDTTFTTNLKPGFYFWKIAGKSGLSSEVRSFSIIKMLPPILIGPAPEYKASYREDIPSIEFTWNEASESTGYIFEAATDKEFKNIFIKEQISKTNFRTSKLKDGPIYWRVTAVYENERAPSSISQVEIEKLKETTPPSLLFPENKFELSAEEFNKSKGLAFKWAYQDQATYKFILSRDSDLENPLYSLETSQSSLLLQKQFEPGTYYWSVGYKNLDGQWVFNEKRKLEIGILAPRLTAPQLISDSQEFDVLTDKGLHLKWAKVNGAEKYKLSLYKIEGSKEERLANEKTTETSFFKKDLEDGKYKWSVSSIDKYGRESKPIQSEFNVVHGPPLDAPSFDMEEVQ